MGRLLRVSDIVLELRHRACAEGENPEHDHGHTDCYLERTAADEIERLRAELAREKRVKAMLNDQIDLERDNAKVLAFWLMHPYVFVHERIIEAVDNDLAPYYGKAHGE